MRSRAATALIVAAAYGAGIICGNIVWLPATGVLAPAFVAGAMVLALPLLLVAIVVALFAHEQVLRRPLVWAASAAMLGFALYVNVDRPNDSFSVQRALLAGTCALCAVAVFRVLTPRTR